MNKFMEYNTQRPKMVIPEYGRNVQKMVDFALSIDDKDERNKVAQAIINIMGQLNPHLRDVEDFKHKLWAHLFIMSDFKLDVESPYPKPSAETFKQKPNLLKYPQTRIRFGHYGKTVQMLIDKASVYDEGEEKDALTIIIANLMKKSYLMWNRDTVNDNVIIEQLADLSNGKLVLKDPSKLISTNEILKNNQPKRKKKMGGSKSKSGGGRNKKRY